MPPIYRNLVIYAGVTHDSIPFQDIVFCRELQAVDEWTMGFHGGALDGIIVVGHKLDGVFTLFQRDFAKGEISKWKRSGSRIRHGRNVAESDRGVINIHTIDGDFPFIGSVGVIFNELGKAGNKSDVRNVHVAVELECQTKT